MSTDATGGPHTPSVEEKARYEQAKKELVIALNKKRAMDRQLAQLETQIYNLEGSYLSETTAHSGGNIIQGFEGYLKNQTSGRRKHEVSDADRMFSNSSLTYQKSLDLYAEGEDSTAIGDDFNKQSAVNLTTVVVPAATKKQEQTAAQTKRDRDREYQRKKRANGSMRSTEPISDEEVVVTGRRGTKRTRLVDDD